MLLPNLELPSRRYAEGHESNRCHRLQLIQNNGREAGMTVPHVHIHIIPRYPESGHKYAWDQLSVEKTEAVELAKSIKDSIVD